VEKHSDTNGQAARRDLVAWLEQAIGFLSQSALEKLNSATNPMQQTDATKIKRQLDEPMRSELELIGKLAKIMDDIDPHSIKEQDLETLFKKGPSELVKDALVEGKLRERRIIIEAKEAEIAAEEAETSRRLVRWTVWAALGGVAAGIGAVAAAVIALFVH
jgi:hypothetical protein